MKICAYNIAVKDAFTGVLFIIAVAMKNFAERHVAADISPSAMVFEADNLVRKMIGKYTRQCIRQSFISEDDIGNQPGRSLFCIEIH